jgi:4-aminobutyrate aminotransferase-like enzyme
VEIVSKGQPDAATTKRIVNTMRERGVLISRIGLHDNILKIRPPMVFTRENADVLLSTLDSVLS